MKSKENLSTGSEAAMLSIAVTTGKKPLRFSGEVP
jgi:hypothetical protein